MSTARVPSASASASAEALEEVEDPDILPPAISGAAVPGQGRTKKKLKTAHQKKDPTPAGAASSGAGSSAAAAPPLAEVKDSYPHAVLGVFYDPAGGSKLHTEAVASAAISKARAAIFSMPDYLGAMQKLVLYHRNKFNDSSYEALAELIAADFCAFLTALPAGDTDSKYLAHVLAAADGELGRIILEAVRAAVRRSFPDVADAHFGRFILTQSDLIPGQGAGIVGVDDNGLPIGIDLGSQNMVVARHCFYTSLLGSQTLRAAARIAKPGGILAIVALRRQIACIARFLVPALNAGSLVSTGISYLSLTPTRKLMPNKELMKLTFTVTGAALPTETVETALGIGSSIASEDPGVALAKRALYAGYRQFCAIREMEAELGVKTSKHASPNAALDSVAAAELLYLVDPDCKPDDHVTAFAQKHGIYVVLAYLILCATSYTDVFQGALVFTTRREAESRAGAGGAAVLSALARLPHKVTEMLGPGCDVELATNDAEHSGPGVYAVEKDEGVKAVGVGVDAAKRSKEQRRAGGRSIYPVRFLPSIYSNSQCSRFLSEALETLLVVMFACLLPGDMIASPATTGGFDAETGGLASKAAVDAAECAGVTLELVSGVDPDEVADLLEAADISLDHLGGALLMLGRSTGKTLAETVNAAVSAGVTREGVLGVTYGGLAAFLLSKRIDASHLKAAQIIRGRIDRGDALIKQNLADLVMIRDSGRTLGDALAAVRASRAKTKQG